MKRKTAITGQALYQQAKTRIPGGTQLLSKRPEMFLPDLWPAYYSRCRGAYAWDLNGKRFLDMTNHGIGTCVLGYADPDVNAAVAQAITRGTMCTLNAPEEVELAETLCELHPWADMVRYARCGGEAMAISVRIARAATGRELIAFCGYHGWSDWYLSTNLANDRNLDGQLLPGLAPLGVPRGLQGTTEPFQYNNREEFDRIIAQHGNRLAAIVMEPARQTYPDVEFLRYVRDAATRVGAVLVFDEVTSGWHCNLGGIHLTTGVNPDIAVFAKAISNGYPMAAIIGRSSVMQAAQTTFISSTYWTDRIGPVAALATIKKLKKCRPFKHLEKLGRRVQKGWQDAANRYGVPVHVSGLYPLSHFPFEGEQALVMKTLLTQHLLENGILGSISFYATWSHTMAMVEQYLKHVHNAFRLIKEGLDQGTLKTMLKGPVSHAGFKRLA
jgi:glutamate-1-semialdehyde 2,1-aminomutase